jgi:hypothetical protein
MVGLVHFVILHLSENCKIVFLLPPLNFLKTFTKAIQNTVHLSLWQACINLLCEIRNIQYCSIQP